MGLRDAKPTNGYYGPRDELFACGSRPFRLLKAQQALRKRPDLNSMISLIPVFVVLPLLGLLVGLWLARRFVLSGKFALAISFLLMDGVGLGTLFG